MSEQNCDWKNRDELKVFYDGKCPICSREINFLKKHTSNVEYQDINSSDFKSSDLGLDHKTLDAQIHGVKKDGSLITGLEVIRSLYQHAGYGWLLAPTAWKPLKPMFDSLYASFARNRHKISAKLKTLHLIK